MSVFCWCCVLCLVVLRQGVQQAADDVLTLARAWHEFKHLWRLLCITTLGLQHSHTLPTHPPKTHQQVCRKVMQLAATW